jgi:hypothetical protein
VVFTVLLLVMMTTGMDQVTAFSAVAATLNNLGPGLGEVASGFADVSAVAKAARTAPRASEHSRAAAAPSSAPLRRGSRRRTASPPRSKSSQSRPYRGSPCARPYAAGR